MNEYALALDLAKAKERQQQTIFVRQGDRNATTIVATITDHGAAASTSGMTARFQMRLPDGTHYYRKAASLSGNVATVALDETQAASVAGRTDVAYFQLLQGSTVVASTESFTVVVLPDALADAEVAESYDSAIQDAIDALDAAVEQMPDMVEDVLAAHPEWTTTVQDGSITKAKLAIDLARDRERLLYRLDNLLTAQLPEGDVATATDAAQTPVAGLALYGRSTQDGTPTPSAPVPIVSVGTANITPFFSNPLNDNDYWYTSTNLQRYGTQLEDGWAHFVYSALNINVSPKIDAIAVKPNTTYTVVLEVRNAVKCIDCSMYVYGGVNSAWATTANVPIRGDGLYSITATTKADPYASDITHLRIFVGGTTNDVDFDMRLALYEGTTAYPYVPYGHAGLWARRTSDASTYTVTPIDLDGHELRSLPDGTRDEVTVDERGHAVLTQRVGSVDLGTLTWAKDDGFTGVWRASGNTMAQKPMLWGGVMCTEYQWSADQHTVSTLQEGFAAITNSAVMPLLRVRNATLDGYTAEQVKVSLDGVTMLYPLATPVTHDLGYVDAVPMCGPDLTAQAVPSAPFALTYERDLNTTLARLESAIATLA